MPPVTGFVGLRRARRGAVELSPRTSDKVSKGAMGHAPGKFRAFLLSEQQQPLEKPVPATLGRIEG